MAVLNITDYGALGDGETDDTAAIQAAIDATTPGDVVHVPEGRYRVGTTDVHIAIPPRQITISGVGPWQSILVGAFPGDGNASGASILYGRASGLKVRDLGLEAEGGSRGYQRGVTLTAESAGVDVRNIRITGAGMGPERSTPVGGVWANGPVRQLRVTHVRVRDLGGSTNDAGGIVIYTGAEQSSDVWITDSVVVGREPDRPSGGIVLFDVARGRVVRSGVARIGQRPGFALNSGYGILAYASVGGWLSDITVNDCHIEDTAGSGIYLAGGRRTHARKCHVRRVALLQDAGSLCVGGVALTGEGSIEDCEAVDVCGTQPNPPSLFVAQTPLDGDVVVRGCHGSGCRGAGLQLRSWEGAAARVEHWGNWFCEVSEEVEMA